MLRILFRCDSSDIIGTGHVTRSLALAEEFIEAGWQVDFCGNFARPIWLNKFLESYYQIKFYPVGSEKIEKSKYDVVCFDHYNLSSEEFSEFSNLGTFKIWIVDEKSPQFDSDLYISTLPECYLPDFYRGKNQLFGLDYALIRKSIRSVVEGFKFNSDNFSKIETVAILTGGTENLPLTELFINKISSINPSLNYLTNLENSNSMNSRFLLNVMNISKSPEFFLKLIGCDLIISPASVSSWEVVYSRIPLAVYGILENQTSTYKFLTESKLATGLGLTSNQLNFEIMERNLIDFIINNESNRNEELIDGLGSSRILRYVLNRI